MLETLIDKFAQFEDPRCDWRVEHKLLDILVCGRPCAQTPDRPVEVCR